MLPKDEMKTNKTRVKLAWKFNYGISLTKRLFILLCCYLIFSASPAIADTHENVARFLPADVAFYGTVNSPAEVMATLLSFVDTELPTPEEAADLLLLTDLADGAKRAFDSSDLGLGVLNSESIHLVVFDSRTDIGAFAILIDKGRQPFEISESVAQLGFRFLAQVVNNGLPSNAHAGQLQEVMSKWESTLDVSSAGRWTVVASSKKLAVQLANQIVDDRPAVKNLASNRRFQKSLLTSLNESVLKFFVSPAHARQIAVSVGFENETVWDRKKRDEIPWMASSVQVSVADESLIVDKKTVVAATVPLTGNNKYWEFYRPIEQFPVVSGDVHTVLGKCVDLESLNSLAEQELDNVYGKGTYDRYKNSAVSAFRTGLSRPKLGNLSFSIMDFENSKNLRLFRISDDASHDEIMGYLDAYFPALQKNLAIGGYDVTFAKREFKGFKGWWSKEIDRDGPPAEQGYGGLVLGDWVVIGTFAQLLEVADLDTAKVQVHETSELGNKIAEISRRMKFENRPHEFGFYRSEAVSGEMRGYAKRLLQRVFPNGWQISQISRERGLEDFNVRKKLTRPQLLALYFTGMVDSYANQQLEYLKVDSISTDNSRFEIGESFRLTKSNDNLESQRKPTSK